MDCGAAQVDKDEFCQRLTKAGATNPELLATFKAVAALKKAKLASAKGPVEGAKAEDEEHEEEEVNFEPSLSWAGLLRFGPNLNTAFLQPSSIDP